MMDADEPPVPVASLEPDDAADSHSRQEESYEPDIVAAQRARNLVGKLTSIAIGFLAISLFLPWWNVSASYDTYFLLDGRPLESGILAPAWSWLALSDFGTKLSIHFANIFALLIITIVLAVVSVRLIARRGEISRMTLFGAAAFSGVGLLLFSLLFPAMGLVGRVFWPWGHATAPSYLGFSVSWTVFPGFFFALAAFLMLLFAAFKSGRLAVRETEPLPEPESAAAQRRSRARDIAQRVLIVPVVWVIIAGGVWAGLSYSHGISTDALLNDWKWGFKSFEPGDVISVGGRVVETELYSTSYGPYTLITLETSTITRPSYSSVGHQFAFPGDLRPRYPSGEFTWIPVHVRTYYYNGIPFTWSDEALAPLPLMFDMSALFSGVSRVAGILILPDSTDPNGTRLDVFTADSFPLDAFNLTIIKGSLPYISESAGPGVVPPSAAMDRMTPLRPGVSDNGAVRFVDSNSNGQLDSGDKLVLNLTPTADSFHMDSYMLGLMGPLHAFAYIAVRERGPFLLNILESDTINIPSYFFGMPPDVVSGDDCSSRVEISKKLGRDVPTSSFRVTLRAANGVTLGDAPANATGYVFIGLATLTYHDAGVAGLLDAGDAWSIDNLSKNAVYDFELGSDEFGFMRTIRWGCGVGANTGNIPNVTLSAPVRDQGNPDKLLINVTSVQWMVTGLTSEYRVQLRKNGTVILPAAGWPAYLTAPEFVGGGTVVLPVGPSSDSAATWLSFVDADGNGFLGAGDQFVVNRTAARSTYELVLFRPDTSEPSFVVRWTT